MRQFRRKWLKVRKDITLQPLLCASAATEEGLMKFTVKKPKKKKHKTGQNIPRFLTLRKRKKREMKKRSERGEEEGRLVASG